MVPDFWMFDLAVILVLYLPVFVGVVVARLTGPLTWARGLIGAATIPFALSAATVVWREVVRHSTPPRPHASIRDETFLALLGRNAPWVEGLLWVLQSLLVGALIIAVWRAADRRRGTVGLAADRWAE